MPDEFHLVFVTVVLTVALQPAANWVGATIWHTAVRPVGRRFGRAWRAFWAT